MLHHIKLNTSLGDDEYFVGIYPDATEPEKLHVGLMAHTNTKHALNVVCAEVMTWAVANLDELKSAELSKAEWYLSLWPSYALEFRDFHKCDLSTYYYHQVLFQITLQQTPNGMVMPEQDWSRHKLQIFGSNFAHWYFKLVGKDIEEIMGESLYSIEHNWMEQNKKERAKIQTAPRFFGEYRVRCPL